MHWIKPSGMEIETNDLPKTIAYCESLGWERVGSEEDTGGADDAPDEIGGDPVPDDPTQIESPVANPAQMDNDADPKPVKRGPGRPRKEA